MKDARTCASPADALFPLLMSQLESTLGHPLGDSQRSPTASDASPAAWAYALVILALLFAVGTSLFGIGRAPGAADQKDFTWMWVAGQCWLNGTNPYDYEGTYKSLIAPLVETPIAFGYAPQSSPLFMGIALFTLEGARVAMSVLSLLSLAAIGVFVFTTLANPPKSFTRFRPLSPTVALLFVALIIASPMTSHVLAMGQTSLIITAATLWGWRFAYTNRPAAAGFLLAFASMKPPFVLLPVIWLLVDRQWKTILWAAIFGTLLVAYPFYLHHVATFTTWIGSLKDYKSVRVNKVGFEHNMGLPNLLFHLGIKIPDTTALACLGTVALYFFRKRFDALTVLGILAALYVSFGVSHDYDALMLVPTVLTIAFLIRGDVLQIAIGYLVVLIFFLPQRLLTIFDVPALLQWRTAMAVVILAWILSLALRRRKVTTEIA